MTTTHIESIPGAARDRRPVMGVMEAIHGRRAVRAYSGRRVTRVQLQALLDAAIQAPSALNLQPWAFVVLQDRAELARLSERARQRTLARMRPRDPLWELRDLLADPHHDVFHGAGTLIVVCAAPGPWPTSEDCCLAAQNLMLAAHALGLGTCPIGLARETLNEPETKRALGIPDDHSVVMAIVVGHPASAAEHTPRRPPRVLTWR